MMINQTDMDIRFDNHRTRTAQVNRTGWIQEASALARSGRTQRTPGAVVLMRRHFGGALVRAGARLQDLPAEHVINSAAAS